jgi:L-threonylcarbamoyladenylate synthase
MTVVAADRVAIAEAARLIRDGRLVAFPTETVYGLGADATNGLAVAAIFEAKGRPRFNPLIVHVARLEAAEELAEFPDAGRALAASFWPGPLTLVLRRRAGGPLSDLVTAGLDTVALRMPDHPVARALLEASGRPLAAPSANRSGRLSPTQAAHVAADLGSKVAMILDGGATAHGIESTVLDATGKAIALLRPGAVPADVIEAVIGGTLVRSEGPALPISPGQLESHYAPNARLRLEATSLRPGEALLAFGEPIPAASGATINLSVRGDLMEAASNLFAALRALDDTGAATIAVMPIPADGLGEAINDRLRRAASPRPRVS